MKITRLGFLVGILVVAVVTVILWCCLVGLFKYLHGVWGGWYF